MNISTHVLDLASGHPATGLPVTLSRLIEGTWSVLYVTATDNNGRVSSLLPEQHSLSAGTYRIQFDTGEYFALRRATCLYPYIEITFEVRDAAEHHHIPLLLSANGYTTYRGS